MENAERRFLGLMDCPERGRRLERLGSLGPMEGARPMPDAGLSDGAGPSSYRTPIIQAGEVFRPESATSVRRRYRVPERGRLTRILSGRHFSWRRDFAGRDPQRTRGARLPKRDLKQVPCDPGLKAFGGRTMRLKVETEREEDGRWLAEVPALPGVLAYGASEVEARAKVQALALRGSGGPVRKRRGRP
jgi:hypothetical protein